MLLLAIIIGIYGYLIFFLGISGLFYKSAVILSSIIYLLTLSVVFIKYRKSRFSLQLIKKNYKCYFSLAALLILIQTIINIAGSLGPELGFDALWYHLTLPKIYVFFHKIIFIPGWLFYYSTMPKLTEMFYTVGLMLGNETVVKIIHFAFGLLTTIAIYKFSGNFIDQKKRLLSSLIFSSNLVVGWMSITSYIDLSRTYFEFLSLVAFYYYWKNKNIKMFITSAVLLGLATSTKLISIFSVLIYLGLIMYDNRLSLKNTVLKSLFYLLIVLTVASPWFIFSFIHTGNPIYPIFAGYPLSINLSRLLNPINFVKDILIVLTRAADPINPIYAISLPLAILSIKKLKIKERLLFIYSALSLITWYFTPQTGGGRFILPFLPAMSICTIIVINKITQKHISSILILLIYLFSATSIVYRGLANLKYLPYLLGQQSKSEFLSRNLNFSFGDFYDIDGYFAKNIKTTDMVLIYGIHNLFYVDFPFIHESYLKPNDWFNYILIGNEPLPQKYSKWILIYQNNITKIKLFAPPNYHITSAVLP